MTQACSFAPTESVKNEAQSKTFNAPFDQVWKAAQDSLAEMDIIPDVINKTDKRLMLKEVDTTKKYFASNATFGVQGFICEGEKTTANLVFDDLKKMTKIDITLIVKQLKGLGAWEKVDSNGVFEKKLFDGIEQKLKK